MDTYLQWFLGASGVVLVAAWLGYRSFRRAAERSRNARAQAETAARADAVRQARDEAARRRAAQIVAQAAAQAAERAAAHAAERAAAQAAERAAAQTAARAATQAAAHAERQLTAQREAAAALAAAEAATAAFPTEVAAPKAPDQTLVLIADDSKVVRVKTGRLLAQHQYRVSFATDGLDAARQMRTDLPDVVITDVEMPGMDGFELTRHVRQNPLTAHIPIIMISAADDKHRDDAQRAGVSVLLGKPYPEDALIAHIRLAMSQGQVPAGRPAGVTTSTRA